MTARRAAVAVVLGLLVALLTSACTIPGLTSSRPAASEPTTAASPAVSPVAVATTAAPVSDLAQGSAHHTLTVPGEQFDLTVDYWSTTPVSDWTVVSAKTLHLSAHLVPHAGGAEQTVAVARVSADTALVGGAGALAGLVTETWADQAPVTGDLPGYLVTADYPYETAVDLAGTTDTLLDRWQTAGGEGAPTASSLADQGVTGYTVGVSFRVEVRNPGDAGFHVRDVADVLTLPLS